MNKKGSILDIFPIMIILFLVILVSIACYKVWDVVNESQLFHDDPYANETMKQTQKVLLSYDNLTVMIFLMLSLVTIVLASQVYNNPAWFFIALMVLVIGVIVAVIISNSYEDIYNDNSLSSAASQFPKTTFLLGKLPYYIVFMGFAVFAAMYIGYKIG